MKKNKQKLIVILGPTASGKTDLSIKLAKKFSGEIISADSRQIYKEMIIGTASPYQDQEIKNLKKNKEFILIKEIPHYLLHIINPDQDFNVAIYKKIAIKIIKDVQKRKKLPFLVGGTGLYISAITNNLKFLNISPDKKLRKKLELKETKELFEIYKRLDPVGSKLIDKNNKRRLIRAIEVCVKTKKPYWEQRKKEKTPFDIIEIGIKIERDKLKKIITKRTNEMFKIGLEKEVKRLTKKYGWITALNSIGYYEWKDYFNKEKTKEEVKKEIVTHTLQYAKRQITWFKKDKQIHWINSYQEAEKLIRTFLKK